MNRKQSFSEHLTIKCPKNTQKMETGTPSAIPTKLLLCIFIEITLQHGCPRPL